ncbi:MAG: hypothetical protein PHS06_04555 [Candidatus Shapirobacteria bacterium]|nr:hypothetical protein [Candidatus Shapirobacteria bacterium]
MANRTDGSSALQDIDQDNFSGGVKVFNIDDYRKNKNPVEQKVVEVSEKITKNLNGDDNLKNELESKIKSIIGEEEVKTSGEEIKDLIEVISKNLIVEDKQGTEIEVKKIKIEIDRWKEENIGEVNEFKKEVFEKKLLEETKKLNPDLKAEESNNVRAYGKLVSEIYFSESIIDEHKDEALQANNQTYSPGKLENAWTDLRGVTNFLTKKPEEIKAIKNRYESIRGVLKNVNLPGNIKETRSFENVISGFNDQGVNNLFSKTQGYLGWYGRVDKLTGGWLNKTMSGAGQKLVTKIGNQAVGEFAKNSLGVIAEQGFQKGISTVLSGILGGGVKVAATTGTAAVGAVTAAGAAAISTTGIGAIVVAVAAAAKMLKNAVSKIAEKLGIGIKKGLEENFGKVGGAIIGGGMFVVGLPFLLIGAISAAAVGPILLLVFGGLFGYQMLMGSSISSLVPPKSVYDDSSLTSNISSPQFIEDCNQSNACNLVFYLNNLGVKNVNSGNWGFVKNSINNWTPISGFNKNFFIQTIDSSIGINGTSSSGNLQCIIFAQATNQKLRQGTIGRSYWWYGNNVCAEVSSTQAGAGDFIHFPTSYHHIQVLSVLRTDRSFVLSEANWDGRGGIRNMAGDNIDDYIRGKNAIVWNCN